MGMQNVFKRQAMRSNFKRLTSINLGNWHLLKSLTFSSLIWALNLMILCATLAGGYGNRKKLLQSLKVSTKLPNNGDRPSCSLHEEQKWRFSAHNSGNWGRFLISAGATLKNNEEYARRINVRLFKHILK